MNPTQTGTNIKNVDELMEIMSEQINRLQSPSCNIAKEAKRAGATATCISRIYQGMSMKLRAAKELDKLPVVQGILELPEAQPTEEEIEAARKIIARTRKLKQ